MNKLDFAMDNIDALLYREILPGKNFDKLIPKSSCKVTFEGIGFTDHSINVMTEWVARYGSHMNQVANVLDTGSLKSTVDKIYWFCYNHFQYKADGKPQKLRSPACSWQQRYDGLDCKSFSIIASSILTELGIHHYIRKIKQPGYYPTEFTHVYVIVPKNQQTADLDSGYYVIDGTVSDNKEPLFTDAQDEFMEGLEHYGLAGAMLAGGPGSEDPNTGTGSGTGTGTNTGSGTGSGTTTTGSGSSGSGWTNWLKKINFKSLGGLFPKCIGGTAYDASDLELDMSTVSMKIVNVLNAMNNAADNNNMAEFSDRVGEYMAIAGLLPQVVARKIDERDWNGCSRGNMVSMAHMTLFYYNGAFFKAFDAWLKQYFTYTTQGTRTYSAQMFISQGIMPFCAYVNPLPTAVMPNRVYTKKPGEIKGFIPTDYIYNNALTPDAFNPQQWLSTLTQAYNIVTNPTGSVVGGGSNPPSNSDSNQNGNNNGGSVQLPGNSPQSQKAGFGIVIPALLIGGAFLYGMNAFKQDRPIKKSSKKAA